MELIDALAALAGISALALGFAVAMAARKRRWLAALGLTGALGALLALSFVVLLPLYLDGHLPDAALEPLPETAIKVDATGLRAVFEDRTHRGELYDTERRAWIWYEETHAADGTISGLGGSLSEPETWTWEGLWAVEEQEICRTYGNRFHCGHVHLLDDIFLETDHAEQVDMRFRVLPQASYITADHRRLDGRDVETELLGQALLGDMLIYHNEPAFHAHFKDGENHVLVQRGTSHEHYQRFESGFYDLEDDRLCLLATFDLPRQCLSIYADQDRYAFARDDGRIVLSGTIDEAFDLQGHD